MDGHGDRIGAFQLLAELGRGTTAVVYRAIHEPLGRFVAIKIPDLSSGAEQEARRSRFFREARILAFLTGLPQLGIPTLYEVAEHEGRLYYARELVEGHTLHHCKTVGSIAPRERLSAIVAVARVVQRAHESGFVHRNLDPKNILIGSDGTTRLIGFGRACPMRSGRNAVTAEIDLAGLRELLCWLSQDLRLDEAAATGHSRRSRLLGWFTRISERPATPNLAQLMHPGSVLTAGAFADALETCVSRLP